MDWYANAHAISTFVYRSFHEGYDESKVGTHPATEALLDAQQRKKQKGIKDQFMDEEGGTLSVEGKSAEAHLEADEEDGMGRTTAQITAVSRTKKSVIDVDALSSSSSGHGASSSWLVLNFISLKYHQVPETKIHRKSSTLMPWIPRAVSHLVFMNDTA